MRWFYILCLACIATPAYAQVNSVTGKLLVDDPDVNTANVTVTITFKYLKKRIKVMSDQEGRFLLSNLPDYDDFYISVPAIGSKTFRYRSKVYLTTKLKDVILGIKLIEISDNKNIRRIARARQDIEFKKIKGAEVQDNNLNLANLTLANWNWIIRDFAFHRHYPNGVSAYGADIADSRIMMVNNMLLNRWTQDVTLGNSSLDGGIPVPFGILASTTYSANWNSQVSNMHLYELNLRPIKQTIGVTAYSSTGMTPIARTTDDERLWSEKKIGLQEVVGVAVDIPIIPKLLMRAAGEFEMRSFSKTQKAFTAYQRNQINQNFISIDPVAQNSFASEPEQSEYVIKGSLESEYYFNAQNNIGLSFLMNMRETTNAGLSDFVLKSNTSSYDYSNLTIYSKFYVNNVLNNMISNRLDFDLAIRSTNKKSSSAISALSFNVGNIPLWYGSDRESFADNSEMSVDFSDQIQINLPNQVINATVRYTYYSREWTELINPLGTYYLNKIDFLRGKSQAVSELDFTVGDRRLTSSNVNKTKLKMGEFYLSLKDEFLAHPEILIKVGTNIYVPTNGTKPVRNDAFEQIKRKLKIKASEYKSGEISIGGFNFNPYFQADWKPKRYSTTISGRLFFNSQPLSKAWVSSLQEQTFKKTGRNINPNQTQYTSTLFSTPLNYNPLGFNNVSNWVLSHPDLKTKSTFGASIDIGYKPIRDMVIQFKAFNNISLNSYAIENLNAEYFYHKVNVTTPLLTYERYRDNLNDIYGLYSLDKGESSYGLMLEALYNNELFDVRIAYEYAKAQNYSDIISNTIPNQFRYNIVSKFNNLENSAYDPGSKFSLSLSAKVYEN